MKVHEILIDVEDDNQKKRYMLVDNRGALVQPVMHYIKYLDNTGNKPSTLRAYCYHLKLYFEFLDSCSLEYTKVNLTILGQFIAWLRDPQVNMNVISMNEQVSKRSERTVNTILTCVVSFYDFLFRSEAFEKEISDHTQRQISGRFKSFKPFLHHISIGKTIGKNTLKLKVPRSRVKTLSSEQLEAVYRSVTNIRDKLLLRILYESGLRISEALNLEISDFNFSKQSIKVTKSKTVAGEGRTVYVDADTMNVFQDYLIDICDEFDSNYVFLTLNGKNHGKQLSYSAVSSMVKRAIKKSNVPFTPHMLRHTYATELHANGVDVGVIQQLLGHSSVQTTFNTYIHPSDETIRKSYNAANSKKNLHHGGNKNGSHTQEGI
ncbi:tyrosine-type recombinase/integrase [Paenibacillus sp. LHD-38]|uniref:tyrosine-type recombinase/integrase n=1 Tax=Paenibacillus sp. LHD-38 TaxID=3072143 RepID=UPI00280C5037|nr:tyrosine-type recombinase/integrase [Paenibacillus sp. LHD-38]MDQ8735805.1 tyrosine-type recombinase/integrase [Paenibacillus sp. LHD-38]